MDQLTDYRKTVAEVRRRRDEVVAAAQAEAREALIAAAARERDEAIRLAGPRSSVHLL